MNGLLAPENSMERHVYWMEQALREAELAENEDEVPIGCVVVARNRIIARSHNLTERLSDVTAHAEMQAITAASHAIGGKYLRGCSVYVTLEPCPMCAGALFWAQPEAVIWAAPDPKRGFQACGGHLHPKTTQVAGPLAAESTSLIRSFFARKRV
jgi:tRNA(adenine34) deaminase